jgi:hypothetical protein
LRWLRCLFTREFSFTDSIDLWDNVFLESYLEPDVNQLAFVDSISLATLIFVKANILELSEQTDCLQLLLNFKGD